MLRTASQDRGSVPGHAPSEPRLISQQRFGNTASGPNIRSGRPSEAPSPSLSRRPALDAEQLSYQRWSGLRPGGAHRLATGANVSRQSTVVYNNDKDSARPLLSIILLIITDLTR